ncbi:hypothetical protein CWB72_05630 [Pseudoalteromonas phenolica]|uniref:PD40 domain-containing protein n=1 Tax=Pseudoalteromonas phenolica TaxID=161398 RepID=UPI00110A88A9|nr:PD40 domain-containing protein [Pseudoalteromonas phenolica]TMN92363.1 hypothetical protein CWB72_05630 [Pseudoalteromonas phenolica]
MPIYGLAWTAGGDHLLIDALHQESARTWQLNPATQAIKPSFKDGTAFNLATHSQEKTVLYSRHRSIEQIVQRDNLGATKVSISSAGRDLYASVQGNNMAFISSRSGTFDIWHKNLATGESTALTNSEGVVGTSVMLSNNMVVYPLKPNAESNSHVYLHGVTKNTRTKLLNDNFNYKHLSWNESLITLLMSSDRSGDWQLWQFDLNTKQLKQVTANGAGFGYLTSRGVFYSKENSQGIYQLNDQQETQVISTLQGEDWGNWQVTESGIYYVQRNQHTDSVYFYDFESQVSKEVFALNRNEIKRNRSLVVN